MLEAQQDARKTHETHTHLFRKYWGSMQTSYVPSHRVNAPPTHSANWQPKSDFWYIQIVSWLISASLNSKKPHGKTVWNVIQIWFVRMRFQSVHSARSNRISEGLLRYFMDTGRLIKVSGLIRQDGSTAVIFKRSFTDSWNNFSVCVCVIIGSRKTKTNSYYL